MAKVNIYTVEADLYWLVEWSGGNGCTSGAEPRRPCPNISGR